MSIFVNICVFSTIIKRWITRKKNPYTGPIFDDCDDFNEARKRIGEEDNLELLKDENLDKLGINS